MLFCAKKFISYCTRHAREKSLLWKKDLTSARIKLCQTRPTHSFEAAIYLLAGWLANQMMKQGKQSYHFACDESLSLSLAQDAINGKLYAIINLTIKAGTATVEP